MERFFDQLHAQARRLEPLYRLAIISRILLALAFFPTGMVKLLGHRFTSIAVDNPIGAFFEAMYQSGFYWNFIGLGQVSAAVLLLIPATSTLGAVLFFPIILNVAMITWSLHFPGTTYITALMLMANTFLLCWDYHRWRGILFASAAQEPARAPTSMPPIERLGYAIGTSAALVAVMATRGFVSMRVAQVMVLVGLGAAVLVLIGWVQVIRKPAAGAIPRA